MSVQEQYGPIEVMSNPEQCGPIVHRNVDSPKRPEHIWNNEKFLKYFILFEDICFREHFGIISVSSKPHQRSFSCSRCQLTETYNCFNMNRRNLRVLSQKWDVYIQHLLPRLRNVCGRGNRKIVRCRTCVLTLKELCFLGTTG